MVRVSISNDTDRKLRVDVYVVRSASRELPKHHGVTIITGDIGNLVLEEIEVVIKEVEGA